jgi:hypothetical protein
MVYQRGASYEQPVQGLIVPKTTDYWELQRRLSQFFTLNHHYKLVYRKKDGRMIAQDGAWISEGLQILPTPYELYSTWSITFTVGKTPWTEYAEDAGGAEIPANEVDVYLSDLAHGGQVWDNVGQVWDEVGSEWEQGEGGERVIHLASERTVYPIWTIKGPCIQPRITNRNNGSTAYFDGTISTGQTLVVDFSDGSAKMDGSTMSRYLDGLLTLSPGSNTLEFESSGGAQTACKVGWNNIVN